MKHFWRFIYNFIIYPLIFTLFHVASIFSRKLRRSLYQRYKIFSKLKFYKKTFGRRNVWFHAASMGEFEHIKPLIAKVRSSFPHATIFVTFFSPSGYDNVKEHPGVDYFLYLPFDFPLIMKRFMLTILPDAFIIAKYDIWPNAVWQATALDVPIFVVNASLGEKSKRHRGLSFYFNREVFKYITEIWVSSHDDSQRFAKLSKEAEITVTGDTKFDQVMWRERNTQRNKIISDKIINDKKVFIAGSIWPEDWDVIIPVLNKLHSEYPDLISILVPHEPTDAHISEIESKIEHSSIRYSRVTNYSDEKFIVVNRVGVLASLYSIGQAAYVGGSFKQNVHNVMEPAVFGIPVLYGPVHKNSFEAVELSDVGGSLVIKDSDDFESKMKLLIHSGRDYKEYSETAKQYVHENAGATSLVIDKLTEYLS
jgi:3-deoxy-D-manno-octulosonic-acid transferase